ncbi:hypothetical protein [Demequina litorisediminis]|uniref:Tetratricopeptide repeat protein n=1 Tax=Demequina litorisediminis TaxID=1849022 RepID=A0ABQ6IKV8_9MICO|nr:hypothetical protein [Demequina litorisediminis]GMA37338.1 hypothetical protein GCM10025876_35420 [Demequina litorisediminis]
MSLRTVRRLNGSHEHLPLMADCERGLGRPERAIALSREPEASLLSAEGKLELEIVVAGARIDMGDGDAALVSLGRLETRDETVAVRIASARVEALKSLGRHDEAEALEATLPVPEPVEDPWADEITLYDVAELELESDIDDLDEWDEDDDLDEGAGPDEDAVEDDDAAATADPEDAPSADDVHDLAEAESEEGRA